MTQTAFSSQPTAIPPSVRRTLRYVDVKGILTGTGTIQDLVFSANGLYDVDITGTGHQPMGFDQYMALYETYIVHGARVTVDIVNQDGSDSMVAGVSITATSAAFTDYRAAIERGGTSYRLLPPLTQTPVRITAGIDVKKWLQVGNFRDREQVQGSISANPAEQVYIHVWAQDGALASVIGGLVNVTIDFDAEFIDPRSLGQS